MKVCQLLAVGRWFPPGAPVSSTSGSRGVAGIGLRVVSKSCKCKCQGHTPLNLLNKLTVFRPWWWKDKFGFHCQQVVRGERLEGGWIIQVVHR